ncbi:MAG: DNA mismatch repair protein MutS, partial [candidate division NC10 bacterium]|nr:DNA mismatch repair protein MutS [candidate division NC10 bacterium]
AVCEQLEGPQKGKRLIRRDVIRVVTPGTFFEGEGERFLAALLPVEGKVGIAFLELATGDFFAASVEPEELPSLFAKFQTKEVLLPEGREGWANDLVPWLVKAPFITKRPKEEFSGGGGGWGFGFPEGDLGLQAAGALLQYAAVTQKAFLPHVKALRPYRGREFMGLDPHTQRNLELTEALFEGSVEGSLLSILDLTLTGMGRRRLKEWVLHPLLSVGEIRRRQDAVEELVSRQDLRAELRGLLAKILDIERLTSRITSEVARPRDLLSLKASLLPLPSLHQLLLGAKAPLLVELAQGLDPLEDVYQEIQRVLLDEPSTQLKEGGLIRDGVSKELDELKAIQTSGHQWLSTFEREERERTGISNLRVGFNKVFGYYIEVTKGNLKFVPKDYIRRQTLVNAERFITRELRSFEDRVLSATEKGNQLEYELFCELRGFVAARADRLRKSADALGRLDALVSLAEVAARKKWVKPEVDEGPSIQIVEGRHPVVEASSEGFVPNDLDLDDNRRVIILTGPNASGKSTFVRQAALQVLLAQMGSFVPAERTRIGLVDRIFTRIGALDFLAKGLSTFMVEMLETATILHQATPRSLVILDEVGRGTGTSDGLAIAQAVVEFLAEKVKAKTLFTTHHHELTALAGTVSGVVNARLEVREAQGDVTFLYKVVPGAAQKSYGLHVAKLAGLPEEVLRRAGTLLQALEQERVAAPSPDLKEEKSKEGGTYASTIEAKLLALDPLRITPLEALLFLTELHDLASKGHPDAHEDPHPPR